MSSRVLVVGEYGTLNGGENSFLAVAPALSKKGWEFHAAVPADSEFANALLAMGFGVSDLPFRNADGRRKTRTEIRTEIAEIIRRVSPDLIHCNSLSTSRLGGPIARNLNLPSLGYLRDILKLSRQAVADINELDRVIAVSKATRDWHCNQGIDPAKTFVVFNGVDSDLFCPTVPEQQTVNPIRSELGISSDSVVLLFVGQIGIRKGVDTLIEAFQTIADAIPDVHLLLVGQRHSQKQETIEYEQRLKDQTGSSTNHARVHWLGFRSDIPRLMRASTVLLHPARQEPLGRVLLEAAASGLPIVTTRVGGSPEILRGDALESLLVPPGDPAALARRTIELLQDSDQLKSLGIRLRKLATQTFSIANCVSQLDQDYRDLLTN